jgi:chromosome segregation ATPase
MVTTWTNGYGAVTSRSEYYEIDRYLTDSAKKFRREAVAKYKADEKAAIAKITAKQAEKRRQEQAERNKQYWDAHTEERAALEAQKKELEAQLAPITEELTALDSKLQEIKKKENVKVPARLELDALQEQIRALEKEKASLGLFKGKEKKALQEQIQALEAKLPALKNAAQEQENIQKQEFAKETAPISAQIREVSAKRQQFKAEIEKINTELTKDR